MCLQLQPYFYMNTDVKTPFKILHEDNHLLIVVKPHGVVSQADEYHEEALDTLLKKFIKQRDNKPGNVFLTAVHRLDKPASGIVILAKTSKALERMHALMKNREVEKTYIACLENPPKDNHGQLVHFLEQRLHRSEVVTEAVGKRAELTYKVREKNHVGTWVEIELQTGRYHQIRAQFAAIGSPILGDKRYGATSHLTDDAIALIHITTQFLHPVTKQLLRVDHPDAHAPLSVFLDKLLKRRSSQK